MPEKRILCFTYNNIMLAEVMIRQFFLLLEPLALFIIMSLIKSMDVVDYVTQAPKYIPICVLT